MSSSVCFIVRSAKMPRGLVSGFFLTEYCPTVGVTVGGCEEDGTYTVTLEGDNAWELETAVRNVRNGLARKGALVNEFSLPDGVASAQPALA